MFRTCFDNDQSLSRSVFIWPLRYCLPKFQLLSQRPPFARMTTDHKLRESQIKNIISVLIKIHCFKLYYIPDDRVMYIYIFQRE